MQPSDQVLCVVDNSLRDFVGHHFEYIRSLSESATEHGVPFVVLGHREASPEFDRVFPVERVFARSHYDMPSRIRKISFVINPLVQNYSLYRGLRSALQSRVQSNWVVFAPSIDHNELFAFASWIRRLPKQRRPKVVLCLRWSYFQFPVLGKMERYGYLARLAFRRLDHFDRVYLATDSERLAGEYARLTDLRMELLPIPHTENLSGATTGLRRNGRLRFVYLGGARKEKGFDVFARAALRMENKDVEFAFQSYLDDPRDMESPAARAELEGSRRTDLILLNTPLNSSAYRDLLQSADVVVIPYRQQYYRSRTSGILAEAIAAGKPVITTADTWMADQVRQYGVGITFKDGDIPDLIRAIETAAAGFTAFRKQAGEARGRWTEWHNSERLFQLLMK